MQNAPCSALIYVFYFSRKDHGPVDRIPARGDSPLFDPHDQKGTPPTTVGGMGVSLTDLMSPTAGLGQAL